MDNLYTGQGVGADDEGDDDDEDEDDEADGNVSRRCKGALDSGLIILIGEE